MPYVSRNKEFSPDSIDGLFVWVNNSNLIYSGINTNLANCNFNDSTFFNNDIIGTNNIKLSNANITFSNYDYAQNPEPLSIPTSPNSFTIFYVGRPGYSKIQNNLVTLFNADSNSIKNSNTIGIVVDSYNIAYATNLQSNEDIIQYTGGNFLINNLNSINIFTATFNKTNSQLWVNGITNGLTSCSNIFQTEDIYKYILTIQSNNGFYTNKTSYLNSFNETLIYDRILNDDERIVIEEYLVKKWNINYPGSFLRGVGAIPGLTNFYKFTLDSIDKNIGDNLINNLFDSSGFSNTLDRSIRTRFIYSSNYKLIIPFRGNTPSFYNGYYDNYIFTPHILSKGITVSFVTTNSFYQTSSPVNTSNVMALFSPSYDNLQSYNYPTVKTDGSYNIFAGGNVYSSVNLGNSLFLAQNKFTLVNLNSFDSTPTTSNIKELCVITMQFIDYKSYGTTQIFMNGYPMMISSNGPSNWLGSNFNLYYAGIPNITNTNLSYSPLDLGETLIYDRILKPSELSLVHQHLFSNYSISNVISSNGLIGWFDAGDYSSSVGRVLNTWNSKYGGLTLSNPDSNSFALVRNYSNIPGKSNLTFIDLNNGTPSYFVNNTSLPMNTYSNLIVFYVALRNSNLASNGYVTSFGHSNGSITYFAQSNLTNIFGNTSNGIYATTDFSSKPNNQPIITGAYASNSDSNLMRFDTVSQNTMTIGSLRYNGSNISNINIGAYLGTNFCKTQIGEVLIYNRPLGKYEYMNIFGYLQSKWCSPTVVPFPTDYVLRYDACNISLDLSNWTSLETKGPLLNKFGTEPVSFAYFNRPFLSNSSNTQYSNYITNIDLQKGFTIFTVTSNANTTGNIIFMSNASNNTLQPNIFLSNAGSSNKVIIRNNNNEMTANSFIPLSSKLLINSIKYYPDTYTYSITTKGTNLEINNNSYYVYNNQINSNITFFIGGLGRISSGLGFNSLIGEVLVYNRALNDYETELVSANLTEKWNTPLLYPISYTNNVVSCNFNLTFSPGVNNTLTLSNFYLTNNRHPFSNAYNFPMIINYTESQLGTPINANNNLVFRNIVGSSNYLIRMSTSNPFGSCNVIIFSNITPPGRVSFSNFQSNLVIVNTREGINLSDNEKLTYSNIILTNILCNDAFGYDKNNKTTIYVTLQSNHNSAFVVGVTCNLSFSENRSNLTIRFDNLTELSNYRLTLYASNPSSTQIASIQFNPAFPAIARPYFQFAAQSCNIVRCNYNFVEFQTLRGAAKTSNASDYYVTLQSRAITSIDFEQATTLRPTMNAFTQIIGIGTGSRYVNLINFRLSNLTGMTVYSNVQLFASNSSGQTSGSLVRQASNSLGFFTTPPGPPVFLENPRARLTSNRTPTSITFNSLNGPFLSCNSTPYPFNWTTTGLYSTNNKSNIFFFYQLKSNATYLTNTWSNLSNFTSGRTTVLGSGHSNVSITFNQNLSPTGFPGSNINISFTNLKRSTPYLIDIRASNSAGFADFTYPSWQTLTA
jgi:hypothetical protein